MDNLDSYGKVEIKTQYKKIFEISMQYENRVADTKLARNQCVGFGCLGIFLITCRGYAQKESHTEQ